MINEFFDKVFVINLDERKDRMDIADCFLKEQGIKYERFPAIKNENGVKGLLLTMRELFKICIERGYKSGVLILEDDFEFLAPVENFLKEVIPQLPPNYLTFHLGLNLLTVPERVSTNILLIDQAYSTHAIVYSREAINSILPMLERNESLAYDIMLRDEIQSRKRSFCTYPMLCTQRTNHSDIEGKITDWRTLSISSFNRMTKSLQKMANEIAYCIGTHKINGHEIIVDPLLFDVQQHPELIGQVCDCRRTVYMGEKECGCSIKEMRADWQENTNQ